MGVNKKKIVTIRVMAVFAIIFCAINVEVYGQKQLNFNNITIEDGLSQATVEVLFQDSRGYMWFGTNDGLNRYNGYRIETYSYKREDKNSINNNYIIDIGEDSNNNIWIATFGGVSRISVENATIINYTMDENTGNLSNSNTTKLLITKKGDILVATVDGLNLYNKKTDSFERIFKGRLANEFINSIVEDEEGNIWVATNSGINKITNNFKDISTIRYDETAKNSVYSLCADSTFMWIGTKNNGAYKIDCNTFEIIEEYADNTKLAGRLVRTIFIDSNGSTWFGTDNGLVSLIQDTMNVYVNSIYDSNSLKDSQVFSIIEDRSGLLWVGTYSGVSRCDPYNKIQHYKNNPLDENSLKENMIKAFYEDEQGILWVGTNNSGVNLLDRKNDIIRIIDTESEPIKISSNTINDIAGYKEYIFVGTHKGVNLINLQKGTNKIYDENNGLTSSIIKKLYCDSKGYLWIGTDIGINIINIKTGEIVDTSILDEYGDVFINNNIRAIYEDSEGYYWVGTLTEEGMVKIDPFSRKITKYKNIPEDETSISSNSIRAIAEDSKGDIWIGTSLGLNRYNKETGEFTIYTTDNGLSNNTVYGILIDDHDNIWVSTNNGISKYEQENDKFSNYSTVDGLQSNEFNGIAYYENSAGEFFFGGINGFNVFRPEEIEDRKYLSKVRFESFKVNGIEYTTIDGGEFKYNENNINIELFLPDYKNIENIQYYYSFGENSNWNLLNENSINLVNISPGKYKLKIKARDNNGEFSEENIVEFTIKPPFWKSRQSIFIYLILIVYGVYRNKTKVKKMDEIINNRTKELSEEMRKSNKLLNKVIDAERNKNSYLVNLSHELRTPLNVIYSTEQLINELNKEGLSKEKLSYYMSILVKNTNRLLKLINDLIDSSKIENGSYHLNIKENDVVYLVEEIVLTLKDYIENKGIELIVDPEVEEKIIQCDKEAIERCIINLVSNAGKFTESGGQITVKIIDLNEYVKIEIIDTGIGIDKKYHKYIFNRFNQIIDANSEVKGGSGLGLTITSQIIELHKGKIYVESEAGQGSTFTIILPVKQNS